MKRRLLSVGSLYMVSNTRSTPDPDGKSSDSDGEDVAESPAIMQVSTITPPKVINESKRCMNGSVIKIVLATGNYISCII